MSKIISDQFEIENNVLVKYHEKDGVTEVVIPDGIIEIGDDAFADCTSLTSITIPEHVVKIGKSAFFNCAYLEKINIPINITKIENGVFADCMSLKNIILPDNLKIICSNSFVGCENLTTITIPESVIEIEDSAFWDCINLEKVIFSNNLRKIGSAAFIGCEKLTNITIPNSVIEIGETAFESYYIKNINVYLYEKFSLLDDDLKIITIGSTLKNYYTGKIKYNEGDINKFKEYIIKNKLIIFEYYKNNIALINIILFEFGINFTSNDIDELLEKKLGAEINAMLLEYTNKNFNMDKEKEIQKKLNKFDLDDDKIK